MRAFTLRRILFTTALIVWLSAVGLGFDHLWRYGATPGPAATVTSQWPSRSLARDLTRPTLVMVLHPECGCSQASVAELARLVAKAGARASVLVLIGTSALTPSASATDGLWQAAAAIPGVTTLIDHGGREALRFGAHVSGQTFLYDKSGRLVFNGGITRARGHAGDNAGEDALLELITSGHSAIGQTPVFGCLLEGGARS